MICQRADGCRVLLDESDQLPLIGLHLESDRNTAADQVFSENKLRLSLLKRREEIYSVHLGTRVEGEKPVVMVNFASPAIANLAIVRGLIINGRNYRCLKHVWTAVLRQCSNCQGFGHTTHSCDALTLCGYCSGRHPLSACKAEIPKCANCGTTDAANYRYCRTRLTEMDRLSNLVRRTGAFWPKDVGPQPPMTISSPPPAVRYFRAAAPSAHTIKSHRELVTGALRSTEQSSCSKGRSTTGGLMTTKTATRQQTKSPHKSISPGLFITPTPEEQWKGSSRKDQQALTSYDQTRATGRNIQYDAEGALEDFPRQSKKRKSSAVEDHDGMESIVGQNQRSKKAHGNRNSKKLASRTPTESQVRDVAVRTPYTYINNSVSQRPQARTISNKEVQSAHRQPSSNCLESNPTKKQHRGTEREVNRGHFQKPRKSRSADSDV